MEPYYTYVWFVLVLVLIVIESATVSLTTIWLAAGSLIAFFLSLFKLPLWAQITAFLVVSAVLLIFTRPVAVKYLKVGDKKTNVDTLIGAKGVVIMDISAHAVGQVKVNGQVWSAASKSGEPILKGTEVVVEKIEGVKLIVSAS